MFVVHRYIRFKKRYIKGGIILLVFFIVRLTGLYAIVIGLTSTLVKFFATGIQVRSQSPQLLQVLKEF